MKKWLVVPVILAVVVGLLVFHFLKLGGKTLALKSDNADLQAEISKLQRIVGETGMIEVYEHELQARLETIEQLERNKLGGATLLSHGLAALPSPGSTAAVRVKRATKEGLTVTVSGSMADAQLAAYLAALEADDRFDNVVVAHVDSPKFEISMDVAP